LKRAKETDDTSTTAQPDNERLLSPFAFTHREDLLRDLT
jgi:hypothetical protein